MDKSIRNTEIPDLIIEQLHSTFTGTDEVMDLVTAGADSVKAWLLKEKADLEEDLIREMDCGTYDNFIKLYLSEVIQLLSDYVSDEFEYNND